MGISRNALARAIDVPPCWVNEIVLGKRGISADTAIRLAKAFGTSERFWVGLQADFDLEEARKAMGPARLSRVAAWRRGLWPRVGTTEMAGLSPPFNATGRAILRCAQDDAMASMTAADRMRRGGVIDARPSSRTPTPGP